MKPNLIAFCLPKPKVGLREQYRHLNSCRANVTFANERLVAAVSSATWIGSVVKGAKIKCRFIISPSVRPAR